MKQVTLPLYLVTAGIILASTHTIAGDDVPFDEAELFFELNDTDGDLGIHGKVDGDEWKRLQIEDPYDRRMMSVRANGRLKRQGITELFFESAEPTFDELDPTDFFKRFPEGIYEIEGITLDGEERENEVFLSHVIPAAPNNVTINGVPAAEDCDADLLPVVTAPVTLAWAPVVDSHAWLGKGGNVEVRYYEVVIEIDDTDYKSTSIIPGDLTQWTVSDMNFFTLSEEGEYKFEILVRAESGNKSAVESCFIVE
ncbi:MAG: hypothetical protein JAY99_06225 [Candidatus Thiodiazotropha lotti]|uniref:Fibronectin type-III domain-containing protein n=1 Tax=Candidatus Thiodiazotropha endoloripes TaxID=1818881 RepID=A0A1E2URJ8_9GAMM|nr:hypothetical protein [Candidatus Thiodiazotropha endoloripes]MCG7897481.1 hypothetical protein [Candidatus Thiodiazotropha weberae]MCG7990265.1 hypothetical protein [Candidatus Thiodiazotropha lotti]MCG7902065.1 hypothetical protein [Candidatus Thiodiazotropha weberae]MCG7999098.1 hypothetical protein [Candidatus Thiodiazotropha lotti]MCW4181919.1 hypothetical protein [Candidatus Thiodiazotropha weberae]